MKRNVIVGPLPAQGDSANVYAVATQGRYELYTWDGDEFIHRANLDVGEKRATIVRQQAVTWPVSCYVEGGDWQIVGADANFTYWAIEVSL